MCAPKDREYEEDPDLYVFMKKEADEPITTQPTSDYRSMSDTEKERQGETEDSTGTDLDEIKETQEMLRT